MAEQQDFIDFPIEFNNQVNADAHLQDESETRLRKLAKGNTDITGASVHILARGLGTEMFEATVVAYARPEHVAATETGRSPEAALKGALSAVERQVRDRREKLRRY